MEFITDRTQEHVNRLNKLWAKGWANMTEAEKTEWSEVVVKGAYNYSDLNRVETAVAEIAESLGLSLVTKTDWTMWDDPTQSEMERYLANVTAIRNVCPIDRDSLVLPDRMDGLNYEAANNIELVLLAAYRFADSIPRSGEIYCGEV